MGRPALSLLQGPATDPSALSVLEKAAEEGIEQTVDVVQYRKDGTSFCDQVIPLPDSLQRKCNLMGNGGVLRQTVRRAQGLLPRNSRMESAKYHSGDINDVQRSSLRKEGSFWEFLLAPQGSFWVASEAPCPCWLSRSGWHPWARTRTSPT
jgi:hypothetical protein